MLFSSGEFSPTDVVRDATHDSLTGQLTTALGRTGHLDGRTLRFEVEGEAIVLHGVVRSYFQKQMAQEAIRPFIGSRRLANLLRVAR
jgi:osmotically-inducible protein OsmY